MLQRNWDKIDRYAEKVNFVMVLNVLLKGLKTLCGRGDFWLVVLRLNDTLTAKVGDANVFPGFLTPELTLVSFQSYRLLFSRAFSRVERRKYAEKKSSHQPGIELTTTRS